MTIAEFREGCKRLLGRIPRGILTVSVLLIVSMASFGLGYLEGREARNGNREVPDERRVATPLGTTAQEGKYVASKNGSKYYLTSCSGADRISDANKVWFASAAEAQAAGYTPAANCKGL